MLAGGHVVEIFADDLNLTPQETVVHVFDGIHLVIGHHTAQMHVSITGKSLAIGVSDDIRAALTAFVRGGFAHARDASGLVEQIAWSARSSSRNSVTQHVRHHQVVPGAHLTHLNDVHPKLAVLRRESRQFARGLHSTRIHAKLCTKGVGDVRKFGASAHRAFAFGCLAVPLSGPQEVRIGITGVATQRTTGEEVLKRGAALQGEAHDVARLRRVCHAHPRRILRPFIRRSGRSSGHAAALDRR